MTPAQLDDLHVIATRYILAIAREHEDDAQLAIKAMDNHPPGLVVGMLTSILLDFLRGLGGRDGAIEMLEAYMQDLLDAIDAES